MLASRYVRKFERPCGTCGGAVRLFDPCPACEGTGFSELRCRTCFTWKPAGEFLCGGELRRHCRTCRHQTTPRRPLLPPPGPLRAKLSPRSSNRKTGPMPVSMTSRRTCPTSCPWLGRGCYAESDFELVHWRRLENGGGVDWPTFCEQVSALPAGQLWRHGEAGDLPGDGDEVDLTLFVDLLDAARDTRGFTYTHKPVLGDSDVARANRRALAEDSTRSCGGLVVNLSADGVEQADLLCDLRLLPVVVVLPQGGPAELRTPGGRRVVTCPALHSEGTCCLTCGVCARPDRDFVVGFPAHGPRSRGMSADLVQLRLL